MTFIQKPQTLADENYNFRLAIDSTLPDLSQDVLNCLQKNYSANNANSIFNNNNINAGNSIIDKNGVKSEPSIFSSYKSIGNLTPEQKKKLDDCAKEIAKINEAKIKVAKEQDENEKDNKTNTKTLETVFKENNLSTTGLSEELRNTTDFDKIQDELDKALEEKRNEQDSLKKDYFGEDAAVELDDIKIENIDKAESKILSDLIKEQNNKYEKCSELAKKLKETEDKMKAEIEAAIKTTTDMQERNRQIQNIQNKYRKDITSLNQQKAKADVALEKARLKVTEYGQKASKNDKTIGLDGKEVKSSKTSADKAAKQSAPVTPFATDDAIKANEELSNEFMIDSGYYNQIPETKQEQVKPVLASKAALEGKQETKLAEKPSLLSGFSKIGGFLIPKDCVKTEDK